MDTLSKKLSLAAFIFELRNNLNNGTRTGVIFFALFTSRAIPTSGSPHFGLLSPKLSNKKTYSAGYQLIRK